MAAQTLVQYPECADRKASTFTRSNYTAALLSRGEEEQMAAQHDTRKVIQPFSLMSDRAEDFNKNIEEIYHHLPADSRIADAYPSTPLQEGLVALSMKQGTFIPQIICRLPADIDILRFKAAWQHCVNINSPLRTVFVQTKLLGLTQVVLEPNEIEWLTSSNLEEYVAKDRSLEFSFGERLLRYAIINDPQLQIKHFVWTYHHAVTDGWATKLLLEQVDQHYTSGTCDNLVEFNGFIEYVAKLKRLSSEADQRFWSAHLANTASREFPPSPSDGSLPSADSSASLEIVVPSNLRSVATTSTIIQGAWALLISRHTNAPEATYGMVLAGRNLNLPGLKKMNGPTFTTIPMRVLIDKEQTVKDFFTAIHEVREAMKPHQHVGLQNIRRFGPDAARSCDFQNLLVVQPRQDRDPKSLFFDRDIDDSARSNAYSLMMHCDLLEDGFLANASFDSKRISGDEIRILLRQLEDIVSQFSANADAPLGSLELLREASEGDEVSNQVFERPMEKIDSCVHEVILQRSQSLMQNLAIVSWDGEITYSELHAMTNRLAHRLRLSNVGPEVIVALMFEKSLWVVVAMMAVMKAGGVFVCLDPSHPEPRLRGLLEQTGAGLLLCSEKFSKTSSSLASEAIPVCKTTLARLPAIDGPLCCTAIPDNACYVIFTSGTSGQPKGVVLEHATCCTALRHMSSFLGMDSASRMLQLSSYTFDACILEILATLSVGGCICIPSEDEKMNDIASAINRMQVTTALMTPSFARLINPSSIPKLKSLVLGGDKLVQDDLDRWIGKLRLFEAYGPTEGCVFSIGNEIERRGINPCHIGSGFLGSYAILDEEMQLVKPGGVGELFMGGPQLARGYLNDPAKTAAAFVETPACIQRQGIQCQRWYKTGDLVRWDAIASSFEYIGRKDSQVKLNGQRIETGEVEYHLRQNIDNTVDLAVVIASPVGHTKFLAAFIHQGASSETFFDAYCSPRLTDAQLLGPPTIAKVMDGLHKTLPRHMIPRVLIPLERMPLTTSGKIDKKKLQSIAAELTATELATCSGQREEHSTPVDEKELRMQQLWATVLNIEPQTISRHDNFIRLGGDSILAMKLVALARDEAVQITVANIFKSPVLSEMAVAAVHLDERIEHQVKDVPAFELVRNQATLSSVLKSLSGSYAGGTSDVTDIYPCTPFQEGVMALSITSPGAYVAQHVFELPNELSEDLDAFRVAWDIVVAANPILRTRIVQTESKGLMQVVSNEKISWKSNNDLEQYLNMDKTIPIGIGSILNRHAIVTTSLEGLSRTYFVWTAHHACYDAWSMQLHLQDVEEQYRRSKKQRFRAATESSKRHRRIPFNRFVENVQKLDFDAARRFWQAEFSDGHPTIFPAIPAGYLPRPTAISSHDIKFQRKKSSGLRTSSLIKAAWAITLSNYSNSDDVVFGTLLSGRTGSSTDLASIAGPTLTTVPVRVSINPQTLVVDYLRSVEAKSLDAMPFEQFGLSKIRMIDAKAKAACDLHNLLVVQPADYSEPSFLGRRMDEFISADFDTYALTMECTAEESGLRAKAIFDSNLIEHTQMRRIVQNFEHILQQLCHENTQQSIFDINTLSPADAAELQRWNSNVPESMETSVHHLLEQVMLQNPQAAAICSWDGNLTRGELDEAVSRLALHLLNRGIGVGSKVPVLFNKSKWAVVAILAIIKAGAAFVPLDPRNPVARLISIVDQIDARIILCSPELAALCSTSIPTIKTIIIDEASMAYLPHDSVTCFQESSPQNALYIIFTSGTTGAPKGTVIEHGAYCAGARDHAKALHFDETSRFLQFASYSFDTSVEDILTTLITGGCLCIPSEEERSSDIIGAISRMNVNTADLTPSFISSISPDDVPSLRRLILGGEPLTSKVIKTWAARVHLINGYGTTECCVTSVVNSNISTTTSPSNIGSAVGAVTWIVDVADSSRLVPIGAVGELLIEGPAIAMGYLNDPERTKKSFVESLRWNTPLVRYPGRHYKTGDLVQYNVDGTINYIGRKDTQVKHNGQRIELGEIEYHLLKHCEVRNALVVLPSSGPYKGHITALIELGSLSYAAKKRDIKIVPQAELEGAAFNWHTLSDHLRGEIPRYMVPSSWIAVEKMPLHTSGKLDRSRLNSWLCGLPTDHRSQHELQGKDKQLISRDNPIAMEISKHVAAIVLDDPLSDNSIAGHDVALADIGIDSIKMMSLAAFIKRVFAVAVPVPLLISHATKISDVAKYIETAKNGRVAKADFSVDLLKEFSVLNAQLKAIQCPVGVVFLTGATGYLGTQLLRQLLQNPGVDRVIAHVRAHNPADALRRLGDAAKSAQWSISEFHSKLEVWTGDLSKPMLGLTPVQWSELGRVDAIIHNGASVNWTADYHSLKAANVNSTFEILKTMSRAGTPTKLVYVSGGRSFDVSESLESVLGKLSSLDGYSQTKFLSEALVKSFAERQAKMGRHSHMATVEPGLIMGTAQEGIASTDDFVWRYVAGAVGIGAYPVPEKDDWLEISSADRVATAAIDVLFRESIDPGLKVKMVDGISMQDFWKAAIARLGPLRRSLQPVSSQEWKRMIQLEIDARTEAHPLWPVAHLLDADGRLGKSERPHSGERAVDEELIRTIGKNVDFLVSSGFLGAREVAK